MSRFRLSAQAYRRITLIAVFLIAIIIVTGAAVRLTGSGLGCPDWPNCTTGSLAPKVAANDSHAWIEFLNRVITGLVSVVVAVAVLGSLLRAPRRLDLVWLSLGLVIGVIAQIILGALVVQELLDPPFVMGHFLLSIVLLGDAVYLHYRAGVPDRDRTRPAVSMSIVWMARLLAVVVSAVLVTGTIVTGAGPHSGDAGNGASLRATRLDVAITSVARLHGSTVMAFLALVLITLVMVIRLRAPKRVLHQLEILLVVLVVQAAIGYIQYFNNVPPLLVGFHVAGATLVFWATIAFGLSLYEPVKARSESPVPTAPVPAPV